MNLPLIGMDTDLHTDEKDVRRCTLRFNYVQAILDAGGLPVMLPPVADSARAYVQACDGIILTGGDDPRTETFGQPTHPKARPMDDARQAFMIALLKALDDRPALPALGICLGMQMMSLHAGGMLHQYLPEVIDDAQKHQACRLHDLQIREPGSSLFAKLKQDEVHADVDADKNLQIVSAHQQAVAIAGRLRVVATADDGVIEAVDDPAKLFYAGVQWHPERGDQGPLSLGLLRQFVAVCRNKR